MNLSTDTEQFLIPSSCSRLYEKELKANNDREEVYKKKIRSILDAGISESNYTDIFHQLLWFEESKVKNGYKKIKFSKVLVKLKEKSNIEHPQYLFCIHDIAKIRPKIVPGVTVLLKCRGNDKLTFMGTISDINVKKKFATISDLGPMFCMYYSETATFDVEFRMSRTQFVTQHRAVEGVTCIRNGKLFPKDNTALTKVEPILNFFNPCIKLNPEQRCAVEHIVAGTCGDAPYLVHGPPGTGKTVTIVEAILQLLKKDPGIRILVCAGSNTAADHIASLIVQYKEIICKEKCVLRVNSQFRDWDTLPKCLERYSNLCLNNKYEKLDVAYIMSYNIVISTLSFTAQYARELTYHISHLFIDEAAQVTEPSCLIPICGLLKSKGTLVLCGDPLQLGAVILSSTAKENGLGLSLMERLMNTCKLYNYNDPNYMVMLQKNMRSHPDILALPNKMFYNGKLIARAKKDPLSEVDILNKSLPSRAIVFNAVLSHEQKSRNPPSYFNEMELELVQFYVKTLMTKHKVLPEDIGIVTPYRSQMKKIKELLNNAKIEVGTVEAFQGKEKRVILVSTVRGKFDFSESSLGFLVDDKRFNVVLTRAKAKIIIIGNSSCLAKDEKWRLYIETCKKLGTFKYIENLENQSEIEDIESSMKKLNIKKKNIFHNLKFC